MVLKVRNIDFNYDVNGVVTNINLRFDTTDMLDLSLNGFVKITQEEYNTYATDLPALAELALTKLKAKVNE